jgi:hypothetical protein
MAVPERDQLSAAVSDWLLLPATGPGPCALRRRHLLPAQRNHARQLLCGLLLPDGRVRGDRVRTSALLQQHLCTVTAVPRRILLPGAQRGTAGVRSRHRVSGGQRRPDRLSGRLRVQLPRAAAHALRERRVQRRKQHAVQHLPAGHVLRARKLASGAVPITPLLLGGHGGARGLSRCVAAAGRGTVARSASPSADPAVCMRSGLPLPAQRVRARALPSGRLLPRPVRGAQRLPGRL